MQNTYVSARQCNTKVAETRHNHSTSYRLDLLQTFRIVLCAKTRCHKYPTEWHTKHSFLFYFIRSLVFFPTFSHLPGILLLFNLCGVGQSTHVPTTILFYFRICGFPFNFLHWMPNTMFISLFGWNFHTNICKYFNLFGYWIVLEVFIETFGRVYWVYGKQKYHFIWATWTLNQCNNSSNNLQKLLSHHTIFTDLVILCFVNTTFKWHVASFLFIKHVFGSLVWN